ncbi:MAG TPA: hypothetical protein PK358_02495 [Spirochaetota bacterium]|nr:hypothetical protein [Spirochaetota bacterium]HPJ33675.1 hypothetical protein [Spirochaetota bacterium]
MKKKIKEIIYSAIIGDASGYTIGGMKKAHIKAVFKDAAGYLDPAPALKGNLGRWRKPGLYSSITQFMFITASSVDKRGFRSDIFLDSLKMAPELPGTEFSFFREPGHAEKNLIMSSRGEMEGQSPPFSKSCARILPISLPLLLSDNEHSFLDDVIRFVSFFTTDTLTTAYTLTFLNIIKELAVSGAGENIIEVSAESAEKSTKRFVEEQHKIFDSGHNPDYFIEYAREFAELLRSLQGSADIEKGESLICESVNRRLKTPVTRGSVNLPEAVLPFAILLSESAVPRDSIIHRASREGGAASALASVSAALSSAFYGIDVPDELRDGVANKKKIQQIIDNNLFGSRGDIIKLLCETEPGLTLKEQEELKARNRKEPKKVRPQKSRKDAESELAKHVVESWTKIDKARWRKEREKRET